MFTSLSVYTCYGWFATYINLTMMMNDDYNNDDNNNDNDNIKFI